MLMEIAVGVIIVIGILGFIGYSYMIKQQSDEVRKLYEDFKKTYGKEYQIGFGLCKGTVFNKEYIVILAADKEKKVVDAVTAEGSGMEWTMERRPSILAWISQNTKKSRKKRKNGRRYIKKANRRYHRRKKHSSLQSGIFELACSSKKKSLPALFMKDSVRKGR